VVGSELERTAAWDVPEGRDSKGPSDRNHTPRREAYRPSIAKQEDSRQEEVGAV